MSPVAWRRAGRADLPAIASFLAEREQTRAGFTGRLLRPNPEGGSSLHLPNPLRGGVLMAVDGEGGGGTPALRGALLCHPTGLAFPILPRRSGRGEASLARELSRLSAGLMWRAVSAAGLAPDVEGFEQIAGLRPLERVGYLLMSLPAAAAAALDRAGGPPGLAIRRAGPADLDALLPLQEAYEREEVLTPIHRLDPEACRAALARNLELQLVYMAEEGGRVVAKAGTNARGFRVDQVGGVFTVPERRRRGYAGALARALLGAIGREGRGACLFVKPGNAPALALYRDLGFGVEGDYLADYFSAS